MNVPPVSFTCISRRRTRHHLSAFTLVEMLGVMAIMGVMLVLVVPAATQILRGSSLTQSGQLVGDQLTLARQSAVASNHRVQVRFYKLPVASAGSSTSFCAIQIFRVEDSGLTTPLTKLQALHTNVMFANDATHSTLLIPPSAATLSVSGSDKLLAYNSQTCPYVGFQYLPDGSTDLDPTANASQGGWFITLVEASKPVPTGQPVNFCSLRVDPVSGRVQSFRP